MVTLHFRAVYENCIDLTASTAGWLCRSCTTTTTSGAFHGRAWPRASNCFISSPVARTAISRARAPSRRPSRPPPRFSYAPPAASRGMPRPACTRWTAGRCGLHGVFAERRLQQQPPPHCPSLHGASLQLAEEPICLRTRSSSNSNRPTEAAQSSRRASSSWRASARR